MTAVYAPGDAPQTWVPGDFLLTRSSGFVGAAIRFGERLRFPKTRAWTNHAVLIVSPEGDIVEALGHGVRVGHAEEYRGRQYVVVDSKLNSLERLDAVRFGLKMVGTSYGYLTIASIIVTLLTGAKLRFSRGRSVICSGLVAAALGLDEWRADPSHVMPVELAVYYGVDAPKAA